MICPKCGKSNQCPCTSCDPNGDKPNKYILVDAQDGFVQCYFCGAEFNEQDSLDHEWNKMIEIYKEKLDPELCAFWFESKNKSDLHLAHGLDSFAFRMAFREHYRVDPQNLKIEDWLAVKRNYKIKKLIQ